MRKVTLCLILVTCIARSAVAAQESDLNRVVNYTLGVQPNPDAPVTRNDVKQLHAARRRLLATQHGPNAELWYDAYATVDESLLLYASQNSCSSMFKSTAHDLFKHLKPGRLPTNYEGPLRLFESKRRAAAFQLLYDMDRTNRLTVNSLADSGEDVLNGFRLAASQRYTESQDAFKAAMRLNPALPIAHLMIGMIAEAQSNHHTARQQYMYVIANRTFRSASESVEILSAVRLLSRS